MQSPRINSSGILIIEIVTHMNLFTCTGTLPIPVHRYRGILRSLFSQQKASLSSKGYFYQEST